MLQAVDDRVGIASQIVYLVGDSSYISRVAVTDGDNGMSAVQVEVFSTFRIPYMASFAFYNLYIK